ncbi:hypothetical protein ElyMa_000444200 [Elysia marginata]|uniref:CS domain-containing protein n=1 Tax=Elysia marginata TaxID=1093978 RepID=A0AAV4FPY5_9GAST|nr:hypothetical protein ElyMa_000444200 [Elysia marginata]
MSSRNTKDLYFLPILLFPKNSFIDYCFLYHLYAESDLTKESQVLTLLIPKDCAVGQVDWHYPKGNLVLEAKLSTSDSVLCIEESWATMLASLIELTDGLRKPMPMPVKEQTGNAIHKDFDLLLR